MPDVKLSLGEWWQWGAFEIPFIGVMVLTLLLLVGSLTNIGSFLQNTLSEVNFPAPGGCT